MLLTSGMAFADCQEDPTQGKCNRQPTVNITDTSTLSCQVLGTCYVPDLTNLIVATNTNTTTAAGNSSSANAAYTAAFCAQMSDQIFNSGCTKWNIASAPPNKVDDLPQNISGVDTTFYNDLLFKYGVDMFNINRLNNGIDFRDTYSPLLRDVMKACGDDKDCKKGALVLFGVNLVNVPDIANIVDINSLVNLVLNLGVKAFGGNNPSGISLIANRFGNGALCKELRNAAKNAGC